MADGMVLTTEQGTNNGGPLLELLLILAVYKRILIAFPLLAALVGLFAALLMPIEYTATLKVAPSKNASTYNWALNNELLSKQVAGELNLASHYQTTTWHATERELKKKVKITLNTKDGYLDVAAADTDPEFAARLANAFGAGLSHSVFDMRLLEASKARYALELRRQMAAANLAKAEKSLLRREVQDIIGQISPMDLYAIGSLGGIQADVTLKAAQNDSGTGVSDLEQSQLIRVQDQLASMQRVLVDGVKSKHGEVGAWIAALAALQDRAYWSAMVERLDYRIELLRKQERDELKISWAGVPDEKSGPKSGLIVALAALGGLLAALVYALLGNAIDSSRRNYAGPWQKLLSVWRGQ